MCRVFHWALKLCCKLVFSVKVVVEVELVHLQSAIPCFCKTSLNRCIYPCSRHTMSHSRRKDDFFPLLPLQCLISGGFAKLCWAWLQDSWEIGLFTLCWTDSFWWFFTHQTSFRWYIFMLQLTVTEMEMVLCSLLLLLS